MLLRAFPRGFALPRLPVQARGSTGASAALAGPRCCVRTGSSSRRSYSAEAGPPTVVSFPASQFGLLKLSTAVPIHVRPLDSSPECPDVSTDDLTTNVYVYIHDHADGEGAVTTLPDADRSAMFDECGAYRTGGVPEQLTLNVAAGEGAAATVWIPFSMGVDLTTVEGEGALPAVKLQNMEGPLTVQTDDAPVSLKSIKGGYVKVDTGGGDLSATSLLGDILFSTQTGSIEITKMQALELDIDAGDGKVVAKAIYANNTRIKSGAAPVKLGSVHGNTEVVTDSGDIFIGSSEGSVRATSSTGSIFLHVATHAEDVSLASLNGNVELSVAEGMGVDVDVDAKVITGNGYEPGTEPHQQINGGGADSEGTTITVAAPKGEATLSVRSWFEATSLSAMSLAE